MVYFAKVSEYLDKLLALQTQQAAQEHDRKAIKLLDRKKEPQKYQKLHTRIIKRRIVLAILNKYFSGE